MKYLLLLVTLRCATTTEELHPTPEQMPQGRILCANLCATYKREFVEYRYDGKCVCAGAK